MLHLPSMLEGLFTFGLVVIACFAVWKLIVVSKGFATRALGLIVLITCALAYFYPNLLGE